MSRLMLALAVAVLLLGVTAGGIAGADPTPTPRPQTCAERYPADGPAGVDLRLGCIASELVGHYTGGGTGEPVRISTYFGPLLGLVVGFTLVIVTFRFVLRRGGRRMAPAAPGAWWLCSSCHSVNAAGKDACYSCGTEWTPEAMVVPTAERPEFVQRFGGDRKAVGDRPGRGPTDSPS